MVVTHHLFESFGFQLRISVRRLCLTPRNVGLEDKNAYPELGTVFKGVHVKMILWYLSMKAIEFAKTTDVSW